MEDSEHHLRLEIAKVLDSRGNHVGRELARRPSREIDIVQDGHFYHLAVDDRGQFTITDEPQPKKIFGRILLGLGLFAFLGAFGLIMIDYVSLKMAAPAATARLAAPEVLGSTQSKTAALVAPLPASYQEPLPEPALPAAYTAVAQNTAPPPAAAPTPVNRQIPLSRGFGEVKEDDGSTKFLIKTDSD